MYVVIYKGTFGFIKPWTAVRDGETFSQQFLTPSIIEGIEKKLFPNMLQQKGIHKIQRHKLFYEGVSEQQEVVQTRGFNTKGKEMVRPTAVLRRGVLINPVLYLAFESEDDAVSASVQHVCLCRNEDILLPKESIQELSEGEFSSLPGFELRFGESDQSFLVGYNRFDESKPMYGRIEYGGQRLL